MQNQFELNNALYHAVKSCNIKEAEHLLKVGADPLGSANEAKPNEHLLGELFDEIDDYDNKTWPLMLPEFLRLFYAYGMDIAGRNIPMYDDWDIHPLWDLALYPSEAALKILNTMLEYELDCNSVQVLVDHILDMEMCGGCDIDDEEFMKHTAYGLKMVMLTASYPEILRNSRYLQDRIELKNNDEQKLPFFRDWDAFDYKIDLSSCTNIPFGLLNAGLTIYNKGTNEAVWKFSI